MVCTVASGPSSGKRPRNWQPMRLVTAQAKDSAQAIYVSPCGTKPGSPAFNHTLLEGLKSQDATVDALSAGTDTERGFKLGA